METISHILARLYIHPLNHNLNVCVCAHVCLCVLCSVCPIHTCICVQCLCTCTGDCIAIVCILNQCISTIIMENFIINVSLEKATYNFKLSLMLDRAH